MWEKRHLDYHKVDICIRNSARLFGYYCLGKINSYIKRHWLLCKINGFLGGQCLLWNSKLDSFMESWLMLWTSPVAIKLHHFLLGQWFLWSHLLLWKLIFSYCTLKYFYYIYTNKENIHSSGWVFFVKMLAIRKI
jgi:hypothetical protein